MIQSKEEWEKPFKYEETLVQKLKRQFELNAELDMDKVDNGMIVDEDDFDEELS
jgi:hypothetical protein